MPEGHTVHRAARLHRRHLAGSVVAADSPQGRFAAGAAAVHGRTFTGADAVGKHLFHRYDDLTVHIHLGLFGRFRTATREHAEQPLPPTTAGTRLRLVTAAHVLQLSGPTACELFDPEAEDALRARLGPDPLGRRPDPERAWAALQRRRSAVGAALLDQRVVAGVGNVYRAELLFRAGVNPDRPAASLTRAEFDALWDDAVVLLRRGERSGRIVTVEREDVGGRVPSRLRRGGRLYVYGRSGEPCRRCGARVRAGTSALRAIAWCPVCQPS